MLIIDRWLLPWPLGKTEYNMHWWNVEDGSLTKTIDFFEMLHKVTDPTELTKATYNGIFFKWAGYRLHCRVNWDLLPTKDHDREVNSLAEERTHPTAALGRISWGQWLRGHYQYEVGDWSHVENNKTIDATHFSTINPQGLQDGGAPRWVVNIERPRGSKRFGNLARIESRSAGETTVLSGRCWEHTIILTSSDKQTARETRECTCWLCTKVITLPAGPHIITLFTGFFVPPYSVSPSLHLIFWKKTQAGVGTEAASTHQAAL